MELFGVVNNIHCESVVLPIRDLKGPHHHHIRGYDIAAFNYFSGSFGEWLAHLAPKGTHFTGRGGDHNISELIRQANPQIEGIMAEDLSARLAFRDPSS